VAELWKTKWSLGTEAPQWGTGYNPWSGPKPPWSQKVTVTGVYIKYLLSILYNFSCSFNILSHRIMCFFSLHRASHNPPVSIHASPDGVIIKTDGWMSKLHLTVRAMYLSVIKMKTNPRSEFHYFMTVTGQHSKPTSLGCESVCELQTHRLQLNTYLTITWMTESSVIICIVDR